MHLPPLAPAGRPVARHRPSPAFTRLECLAVATSVLVLAALGLPSIARTQVMSGLAGCIANQRQLAQAFQLYAQDNADALVGASYASTNGPALDLVGGGFWPGPARPITAAMSQATALESVMGGLARGPLWPFQPNPQAYHCPADRRASALQPGSGWAFDSYSKPEGIGTGQYPGITAFKRIGQVRDPAATSVLLEEADPRGSNLGTWVLAVSPPGWVDVLAAQHDDGAQFGFLDGHTELRRWADPTFLTAARASMSGTASFFPAGASARNPDFVWVWNRFQHANWKPLP